MSRPIPDGSFLLGCDYQLFPNGPLRDWVWSRQVVNASTHRILVDVTDSGTLRSYWYWAVPNTEKRDEHVE